MVLYCSWETQEKINLRSMSILPEDLSDDLYDNDDTYILSNTYGMEDTENF